ncbi:MAG TPA: VanZ family protein, partial [Candidatus Thermoplasmatota archaeon]|nr:VanZ family protein [Candidatus Thermoplasmatota archaeon]
SRGGAAMRWRRPAWTIAVLALFVYAQWTTQAPGPGLPDKALHSLLYAGFALVLWTWLPPSETLARAGVTVAAGYLVGLVMEAGQASIPGRTPDVLDVAANLAGLLGATAGLALGEERGRRKAAGPVE